ncbi:MAG: Fur family transcriptional regulator [Flavobacteriales bacterium]
MTESKEALQSILKSHQLRVTQKRLDVLAIIRNYESAIPHSRIQEELKNFDRVTLYRTILALLENGIIHKIHVEGKEVYYALCGHSCDVDDHNHQHVHFNCVECESVTCLEPDHPFNISLKGFQIEEVDVQLKGVCDNCTEV